jgi:alanyl-tRNA synthetase
MADADDTVKCLSAKEIKELVKPEFAANPELFYPVKTLTRLGFTRAQCPVSKEWFWRHTEKKTTCGDSNVEGKYTFIGNGFGKGKKISYAEAW